MMTILDELHGKWDTFTEKEQLGLAEAIAGKQQSKVFQSLMTNFKDVIAVRDEFAQGNHFGSAEAENSAYLDSISGKLNTLKETWISILSTFAQSESIKGVLDVFIAISEAIDTVVKALDNLGVLLPATLGMFNMGKFGLKNLAGFGEKTYEIKKVGESLQIVKSEAKSTVPVLSGVWSSFSKGDTATKKMGNGLKAVGTNISKNVLPSLVGMGKGLLSTSLQGIALGLAFKGIGWALDNTVGKYDKLNTEVQSQIDESDNYVSSLRKQKDSLSEIAKEYDSLSKKSNKTAQEEERYAELRRNIAEISPELVMGYDQNDDPILKMSGSMETYIGKIEQAIEKQKTLQNNLDITAGKNAREEYNRGKEGFQVGDKDDKALLSQKSNIHKLISDIQSAKGQLTAAMNSGDIAKAMETSRKVVADHSNAVVEGYRKVIEAETELAPLLVQARKEALGSLSNQTGFKKATQEVQQSMQNLIGSMDVAELSDTDMSAMINSMNKALKQNGNEIPKVVEKYSALREELEKTQQFEEYEKNVAKLVPEMAKFLGISEDAVQQLVKTPPAIKSAASELDAFLMKFGKREIMAGFDVDTQKLQEAFESIQQTFNDFSNTSNIVEVDGKVQLHPDIVTDALNNVNLPEEFRKALGLAKNNDGFVSPEEVSVLTQLLLSYQIMDSEKGYEELTKETQKNMDKLFGENKIDVDDVSIDMKGKVENVDIDKGELEKALSVFDDREEVKELFVKGEVVGMEDIELFESIASKLPTTREFTNKFIVDNAEALSKLETYEDVIDYIAAHPDLITKYNIDVTGNEKLEKALADHEKANGKQTESVHKQKVDSSEVDAATDKTAKLNEEKEKVSKEEKMNFDISNIEGSAEALNQLAKASEKIGDGKYKISFDSDTSKIVTDLQNLSKEIDNVSAKMQGGKSLTITIHTALASQNVTGLMNNIEKFSDVTSGLKTIVFNTDTALASKNVTGLRNNVSSYIDSYCGKSYSTKFNTQTALASQNVTGLRNNVSSYVSSYAGKTYTTTFKVVTKYSTQGTPTPQSGQAGKVGGGKAIHNPQSTSPEIGPSTFKLTRDGEAPSVNAPESTGVATPRNTARATIGTPIAVTGQNVKSSLKYSIELLKELENRIDAVGNRLSLLDKKMEHALGKDKIKYLEEQNVLYQEQLKLQKELEVKLKEQQNHTKNFLKEKGFQFTSDGNLKNYEEKLIAMEKEADRLEEIASRDKASDKQKKASENYKKNLEEIKKYLNEYLDITFDKLPKVEEEFINIDNAIKDNINSIKEYKDELRELNDDSGYKNHNRDIKEVENLLDKNEIALENATGEERNKLLQERTELYKRQQKEVKELLEFEEQRKKNLMEILNQEYGFTFRDDGSIVNYGNKIAKLKETLPEEEFDRVFSLIDDYFETSLEKIPELEKEWLSLNGTIDKNADSIKNLKDELKDLAQDSGYKNHNRDIWEIENKLDKNEIALEHAVGQNRIELLEERIKLTLQLKKETGDLLEFEKQRQANLKKDLGQYGFNFRDDGSIVNYGNKIEELKNSLSEEEFEKVFAQIEDYLDTTYEKIPELENQWLETENQVKEYADEVEKLVREGKLSYHLNQIKEIENEYDKLADKLDIIDIKLKHAKGTEKIELLEEQIKLLEEQRKQQLELAKEYESMRDVYQGDLIKYGVKFDANGDITNLDEVLNSYKDHQDIEKLKELIDEYLEIQRDKLPDVQKEWENLSSQIKDAYKEQLQVTKEIEDKITQVYKKQVEERKKLIDKELNARLDALKKEQDAYNDARKEADYKKDYDEQLGVIEDLQKQLDIAMKDDSLSGQKKVQELLKKLKEEQKKLEEMVQDKIDDQVNDMFDKESDRLTEEADKVKEDLDEKYSDENLKQIVKDALTNGVFVDIDGNIKDLEDTLLEFEDKFGEGMTAIGEIIKSELVTNLEVAKETMKDFSEILDKLDLGQFASGTSKLAFSGGYSSGNYAQSNSSVQFNSPLLIVEGNVTKDVIGDLKGMMTNLKNQITKDIVKHIK